MKKVLFIHDGPRWKDKTGIQYGTATDADMYERYRYLGNKVEFVMRVFEITDHSMLLNLNNIGLFINPVLPFNRPGLLKNYFKSKKLIKKYVDKADILVIRLPSTIGSVALRYARKIGKPYLVEVVACPWDSLKNHSLLGVLYAPYSRFKLKKLVAESQFVIYVTDAFLQRRYPTKYQSAGISDVVLKNFPIQNCRIDYYSQFDSRQRITITTLGVVNLSYKGQQYVLMSMAVLVKEGFDIHYNIVGGGDNTRLLKLAEELRLTSRTNFTGKLPHDKVFGILEHTDLYIQPSETEGLPRALIEAMSRGCVCIGSDAGGIPELLDKSAIFKSKNVSDLAKKIKFVLNKETLSFQSQRNFEFVKKFGLEKLNAKRQSFYDKFLKSING